METKDNSTTENTATSGTKTENVFTDMFQFYVNQFEQYVPVAKQAIEDWYTLYGKIWDNSIKLQEEFYRQWTSKTEDTGEAAEQGRSFAQKIINTQKDIALTAVDMAAKNIHALKRPAETQA